MQPVHYSTNRQRNGYPQWDEIFAGVVSGCGTLRGGRRVYDAPVGRYPPDGTIVLTRGNSRNQLEIVANANRRSVRTPFEESVVESSTPAKPPSGSFERKTGNQNEEPDVYSRIEHREIGRRLSDAEAVL